MILYRYIVLGFVACTGLPLIAFTIYGALIDRRMARLYAAQGQEYYD